MSPEYWQIIQDGGQVDGDGTIDGSTETIDGAGGTIDSGIPELYQSTSTVTIESDPTGVAISLDTPDNNGGQN